MTMRPGVRKFTLAGHLTLSVGWIGAVAAYLALDIAGATSKDPQLLRAAYLAMEVTARYVIVPLAFASLITGLVISLGTKWGLFRHYWVLFSLVMTTIATVVLLIETQTISHLAGLAASPTASAEDLRALPSTLGHSVGGTIVLVLVLVLNIYKPRGMTRYGQRQQHEERLLSQRRPKTPEPARRQPRTAKPATRTRTQPRSRANDRKPGGTRTRSPAPKAKTRKR